MSSTSTDGRCPDPSRSTLPGRVVGNLARDPEIRYTPTGQAVAKFGIAVNRFYTNRNGERIEQTDFFNVNAWCSVAENVAENVAHHRARVLVTGRLQARPIGSRTAISSRRRPMDLKM